MPKDIQASEQDQPTITEEVHTSESEIDWKAQARKWEKRAKENASAKDELTRIKEAQMTELERAQTRATQAEEAYKKLKTKTEQDALKQKIATEMKVPASLISGSSEEDMREWAKSLAEFAKPQIGASVPKNSVFTNVGNTSDEKLDFARKII